MVLTYPVNTVFSIFPTKCKKDLRTIKYEGLDTSCIS